MANVQGLDASHWNTVRWVTWADNGYVFAWIKASEGTTFIDNEYLNHTAAAKDAGFYVAPYMYFRVQENGALQAAHFKNIVGDQTVDMPPVIDVEKYNNLGYSQAVFAARLRNCLLETENLFGRRPVIYTSLSMWNLLVGNAVWASAYDLWVAHYTSYPIPLIPADWRGKGYKVWQYTSTPLDQNRFNGNMDDFLEWIGQPNLPPVGDLEGRVQALEAWKEALHATHHAT